MVAEVGLAIQDTKTTAKRRWSHTLPSIWFFGRRASFYHAFPITKSILGWIVDIITVIPTGYPLGHCDDARVIETLYTPLSLYHVLAINPSKGLINKWLNFCKISL